MLCLRLDVVECVVNDEKVHLTKEDLALSNTKIENWFTQQNKWLAVVLIASIIGILSFIIGMIWLGNVSVLKILLLLLTHLRVKLLSN